MELIELKGLITKSLSRCQRILNEQPDLVLSEADFERLVSWSIMKQLGHLNYKKPQANDYIVHTQISHYPNGDIKTNTRPNIRPDILLITKEGMIEADKRKGFIYDGPSFTLELKYLRKGDSTNVVRKDFNKRKDLYDKSWLMIVVLIEPDNDEDYLEKKMEIEEMCKKRVLKNPNYRDSLFCITLKKQKVHYFVK